MKKIIKALFFIFVFFDAAIFVSIYFLGNTVAKSYSVNKGEYLNIESFLPVTAEYENATNTKSGKQNGDTFEVDLKMFGVIPFSRTKVKIVDDMQVAVLGNPFGMKVYTDGVLVIELSDINTAYGNRNPAKEMGIKTGDYIASVNGKMITCNEDLSEIVASSNGEILNVETVRNGKKICCKIKPVLDAKSGVYRIGVWVRDSSAGIGTLTFYCPANNMLCGLGHGICDNDTDTLLSLESGELVGASIISVNKGKSGEPGELRGKFTYDSIADIELNSEIGVFGKLKGNIDISNLTEIALKQDVQNGKAQILCTIDGQKPKLYACEIKKRNGNQNSDTQNLTVTVTDKDLLQKTGGIVQGMSGSPLIQNGKLIGAITHVLVDDPTTGYAIFAENMLETAQSVANKGEIKDAS